MKKKFVLAAAVAAIMMLGLAGCGVKVTNIAIPETAVVEKGETITLPVNFGTDDAPAVTPETAATGESAETDEKLAKAASKLTVDGLLPMRVSRQLMRLAWWLLSLQVKLTSLQASRILR